MAAKLLLEGLLCFRYSFKRKRWESKLRTPRAADLFRITELQPGLTIGDILDILVRDSTLADFLGQLCWCDVAAIQQQPRGTFEQLLVYPSLRAERAHEGGVPATHLLLEKAFDLRIPLPEGGGLPARYQAIADFLNVSTVPDDPNVEVAQLPADLRYRFLAARDDVPFRTGIASPGIGQSTGELLPSLSERFSLVVNLPLRLSESMIVYVDCVPKKTASVTFTLLEILTSILYSLGDMPYHLNSHLETIETVEQLRKVFDVDEDEIEDDEL